eukprot:g17565.t1
MDQARTGATAALERHVERAKAAATDAVEHARGSVVSLSTVGPVPCAVCGQSTKSGDGGACGDVGDMAVKDPKDDRKRCYSCLSAAERDQVVVTVKEEHLTLDSFFAGEPPPVHVDPEETVLEKAHRLGSLALGGAVDLMGWIPVVGSVTKGTIKVLHKVVKFGPLALYTSRPMATRALIDASIDSFWTAAGSCPARKKRPTVPKLPQQLGQGRVKAAPRPKVEESHEFKKILVDITGREGFNAVALNGLWHFWKVKSGRLAFQREIQLNSPDMPRSDEEAESEEVDAPDFSGNVIADCGPSEGMDFDQIWRVLQSVEQKLAELKEVFHDWRQENLHQFENVMRCIDGGPGLRHRISLNNLAPPRRHLELKHSKRFGLKEQRPPLTARTRRTPRQLDAMRLGTRLEEIQEGTKASSGRALEVSEMSVGFYYLLLEHRNRAALDPDGVLREHGQCPKVEASVLDELVDCLPLATPVAYAASAAEAQRQLRLLGNWELVLREPQAGLGPGGQPAFVVAADRRAKRVAVLVPGTQSPGDCVTDLKALPVRVVADGSSVGWVHRGMMRQACAIVRIVGSALERFEKDGYEVLFIGHSLSAGVSAIAGAICRLGIEGVKLKKVRSLCYATPAVGNGSFGKFCEGHAVTVINCEDIVPRLSIETARKLREELSSRLWYVQYLCTQCRCMPLLLQDIEALKDINNITEKKTRSKSASLTAAEELAELGIPAPQPGTSAKVAVEESMEAKAKKVWTSSWRARKHWTATCDSA